MPYDEVKAKSRFVSAAMQRATVIMFRAPQRWQSVPLTTWPIANFALLVFITARTLSPQA